MQWGPPLLQHHKEDARLKEIGLHLHISLTIHSIMNTFEGTYVYIEKNQHAISITITK